MTEPSPDAVAIVAEALRNHVDTLMPSWAYWREAKQSAPGDQRLRCSCGEWSMPFDHLGITEAADEHRLHRVQAVLAALADAGLLLPPGGEVRQGWRSYDTVTGGSVIVGSRESADEWTSRGHEMLAPWDPQPHPHVTQVCTVTTYPDGTVTTGPWRDVADEGPAERDSGQQP